MTRTTASKRAPHLEGSRSAWRVAPAALLVTATLAGLSGCTTDKDKAAAAIEAWLKENPEIVARTVPMSAPVFTELRAPELDTVMGFHRGGQSESERDRAMQALAAEGTLEEETLRVYPFKHRTWTNGEQTAFLPAAAPATLEAPEAQSLLERLNADHPGDVYLPLTGRGGTAYFSRHGSFKRFENVTPAADFVAALNREKPDDPALESLLEGLADQGFLRREDKTIRSDWTGVHIGTWTGRGGFAGYEQRARLYFVTDKGRDLIVDRGGRSDKRVYPQLKLASAHSDALLDKYPTEAGFRDRPATQITFAQQRQETPLMKVPAVRDYVAGLSASEPAYQRPAALVAGSLPMTGIFQVAMTDDRLLEYGQSSMAKAYREGPETLHVYEVAQTDAPLGPGSRIGTGLREGKVTVALGNWQLDQVDEVFQRETEIGVRRIARATFRFVDNPATSGRHDTLVDLGMSTDDLPANGTTAAYECQLFREGEAFTAKRCREADS